MGRAGGLVRDNPHPPCRCCAGGGQAEQHPNCGCARARRPAGCAVAAGQPARVLHPVGLDASPGERRAVQEAGAAGTTCRQGKRCLVLPPCLPTVHAPSRHVALQGSQAIADVLFGDVSPSGRLPVSFPFNSYTAQSDFYDMSMTRFPGRTHRYLQASAAGRQGRLRSRAAEQAAAVLACCLCLLTHALHAHCPRCQCCTSLVLAFHSFPLPTSR